MLSAYPWLYRWEAKGIQRYILQSDKLQHLRGASNAIVELGEKAKELAKRQSAVVLQSIAGVGVYGFPSVEALRAFAEEWPMQVETEHCPGLQVAHGWLARSGDDIHDMRQLIHRVAADRNRPRASFPEPGPLVERAARTGRAAVSRVEGDPVDRVLTRFIRASAPARDGLNEDFDVREPVNDDIQSWPAGYVAVVHVDGNGVGRRVQNLPIDRLQEFSTELQAATKAAAAVAVRKIAEVRDQMFGRSTKLPFRPVVLGGDDVTVIVHAALAFDFATAYLRAFEEQTARREVLDGKQPLRAAAGLAFVHRKFPFSEAHALAEALVKGAKASSRDRSLLLFHRVTTSVAGDWNDVRDRELAHGALAFGPYGIDEGDAGSGTPSLHALDALCKKLPSLRLGRGALRTWAGMVSAEGVDGRAAARWARIREILTKRGGVEDLDHCLRALGAGPSGFRLRTDGTPDASPVYDALTLAALGTALHPGGR